MPTPGLVLNDIVSVNVAGFYANQRIMICPTYQVTTAPAPGGDLFDQLETLANALDVGGGSDLITPYLGCLSNGYTTQWIKTQLVAPVRYRPVYLNSNVGGTGGVGGASNLAAVLTKVCALAGRKYVGNFHVGPIPDAYSVDGEVTGPFHTKLELLKTALLSTLPIAGGGTLTPIIYHQNDPGPVLSKTWVQDINIQSTTRVVRRRTLGRGE